MKKTLITLSTPLWEDLTADAIEIGMRVSAEGGAPIFLRCQRAMSSCASNPLNKEKDCSACVVRSDAVGAKLSRLGATLLELPQVQNQVLEFEIPRNIEQLRKIHYKNMPLGRLAHSHLADLCGDTMLFDFSEERSQRLLTLTLSLGQGLFEAANRLFQAEDFNQVFVWNGRRVSDGPIWWAAKHNGLDARTFISGGTKKRTFVSRGSSVHSVMGIQSELHLAAESRSSIESSAARIAASRYLQSYRSGKRASQEIGYVLHKSSEEPGIQESGKMVLILVSSPAEYAHMEEWAEFFRGNPFFWVKKVVEELHRQQLYDQIVVKWHPNMANQGRLEHLNMGEIIELSPEATHILPSEKVDAYRLADMSSLVVSNGSTVGLYAATKSKPVIVLGPNGVLTPTGTISSTSINSFREALHRVASFETDVDNVNDFLLWWSHRGGNKQFVKSYRLGFLIHARPFRFVWLPRKYNVRHSLKRLMLRVLKGRRVE